jgi:truncated hemoglobin YjbI
MDNGTGLFKQIYFKADVDLIVQTIYNYINENLNTKTFFISGTEAEKKTKLGQAIQYYLS